MKKSLTIAIAWSVLLIFVCSGCTVVYKKGDGFYASLGTNKRIKSVEYGTLKIEGINVNQSQGVKAVGDGVAQGLIKGAKGF